MQFLPLIALAGVGVVQAVETRNAGIAQANAYKAQIRTEGDAAKQREIDRRRDLLRALSSQNARAGALGIETGGSLGGIMSTDIKEAQMDLATNSANFSARKRDLLAAASNAKRAANWKAVSGLLGTAAAGMKMWPGGLGGVKAGNAVSAASGGAGAPGAASSSLMGGGPAGLA